VDFYKLRRGKQKKGLGKKENSGNDNSWNTKLTGKPGFF
jgi:hypothetical protein